MYTKGTGSGHLARINAVYKGFQRAGVSCEFIACAPRSKYRQFLLPGIELCRPDTLPSKVDIFICDWRADEFVESLPLDLSPTWVGLRRLGKMKASFPPHFHTIAIEPNVKGDICIWPIIVTWPDELASRAELSTVLGLPVERQVALLCENGAYPKHLDAVFDQLVPSGLEVVRCSNSPFSEDMRQLNYYPVAELFKAIDFLVIGAGYNSIHEAMCYADLSNTLIVRVGGDDQALRLAKMPAWERKAGPASADLATHIMRLHAARPCQEI